jgi:carbon starvation protein
VDALALVLVPLVGYLIAYRLYGRFLAGKIFCLRPEAPVPSRELEDGQDYVPARKGVIFGHHFTSIAGTGPIVGPAIGIIWGWVPALVWVFVGSIVMGAVHDFGALVISMRHEGKSLSEIAARYINGRVRTIFFLIVFFELWIVIGVFALVIALLFNMFPQSVFPIWMEIPIAVAVGWAIYRKRANVVAVTVLAVTAMYVTVAMGHWLCPRLPQEGFLGGWLPLTGAWALVLLAYAFVASTLPVTTLLQPRDYINAWQLFVATGLLIAGAVASSLFAGMSLAAPAWNPSPAGAPPLWPFLFVTIACGAISGFHSLVASGTSPKQISSESDALFVGYGSMLMEGALAVLIICVVGAGLGMRYDLHRRDAAGQVMRDAGGEPVVERTLTGPEAWRRHYSNWNAAEGMGSTVGAVVIGSANMLNTIGIPRWLGIIVMGVFIASFAGTTLDTATRLQRYVIAELAGGMKLRWLAGKYTATTLAVVSAAALVFVTGAGGRGAMTLWPMFGAVNQLLAALALLLVTVYLRRKGGLKYLVAALPCVFMLAMTVWAMAINERNFIAALVADLGEAADPARARPLQNGFLVVFNSAVLLLALWMTVESAVAFLRRGREAAPGAG